jgi:hypothetical protein
MSRPRLLYLGFAFPPGVQALHPGLNPAGHLFETNLVAALRPFFEIRSVGMLPFPAPAAVPGADPASGVAHDLVLEDRPPAHIRRRLALARLERRFRRWRAAGWEPDAEWDGGWEVGRGWGDGEVLSSEVVDEPPLALPVDLD